MDSTLPHLNDSGGTLIGPLMDARWSVLRRQLPEKQAGAIYTLNGNTHHLFELLCTGGGHILSGLSTLPWSNFGVLKEARREYERLTYSRIQGAQ